MSDREQAISCEFRKVTKFSIDDCFCALKDDIPKLSRSNLYRCLKRNNLGTLPKEEKQEEPVKKFKNYPIGFIHMDIAQVHTSEGKAYLFVAVDRKTRSVFAEINEKMTLKDSCQFLKKAIEHFPFKIHTILTDNGAQFTYRLLAKNLRPKDRTHPFDKICESPRIRHKLTKFMPPWTNGLVERMNRTIKDATVKIYFYETLKELKDHLNLWLLQYNFEKQLKSLNYKTPYDMMTEEYEKDKLNFSCDPLHKIRGLNTPK
ncbi:MAG: transposase family protein [Proteobacteria bacterium]|nr:transposase family protein [Pseudomonadota bacterium]